MIQWAARSDVGRVRSRNEDSWVVEPLANGSRGWLLAVADGMGGHPGGAIASRLAIEVLGAEARAGRGDSSPGDWLGLLFQIAQDRLSQHADLYPGVRMMGTTLTAALLLPDGAWVGHIGDSRLLWLRDSTLRLVTRDHNAAWESVEAGALDPEEAERHPSGAWLTRHLGPAAPLRPEIAARPLALLAGDRLLLCSDGLGKVLRMNEIAAILRDVDPQSAVDRLTEGTLAGGAPDNVTVIVAEASESSEPANGLAFQEFPFSWSANG